LTCDKVWGPKKNDALQYLQSTFELKRTLLPAQVSTIADCNLSDQDLFHLRYLHQKYWNVADLHDLKEVVLQSLFCEYGFTFPNKTLLYAALAYSRNQIAYPEPRFYRKTPFYDDSDVLYWQYVSLFTRNLFSSIRNGSISECHLFAIFLALTSRYVHERDFEVFHTQGFATVFKLLTTARQNAVSPIRASTKLAFLWHHMLKFLCRFDLVNLGTTHGSLVWKLHDVSLEVASSAVSGLMDHKVDYELWVKLVQLLVEEDAILHVCLERLGYESAVESWKSISKVTGAIASVKRRLAEMTKLPFVQELFCSVVSEWLIII